MDGNHELVRDRNGFRLRGGEVTRLEAFVDAAFAFAVTLLVVSFDALPETYSELVDALKHGPAFVAGFAILAMFWSYHYRFSRRYGLEDGVVLLYSLALVGLTLLYVYPLRLLMGLAVSGMTGGWAPSSFQVASVDDLRGLYVIYAAGFGGMSILIAAIYWHAYRKREQLGLDALECLLARTEIWSMLLLCVPAVLSALLAMLVPMRGTWSAAPGAVYMLLPVIMPIFGGYAGRLRKQVRAEMAADAAS